MENMTQKLTPMMEQWHQCKQTAKGALLLFRMGDFYEAFHEDARLLSEELDLTLTKRQEIPMSGIPWHAAEGYIDRLIAKGYRIAIAEQTEDPKKAKGLVKREIVRIITPGTVINSSLLSEKASNFIVCIAQVGSLFGLAALDITTASFRVCELDSPEALLDELLRLAPSEIIASQKFLSKHASLLTSLKHLPTFALGEWPFDHQTACHTLNTHFHVSHLDGFGLKGMVAAINAAGALLTYLRDELSLSLTHITTVRPYSTKELLLLDPTCQRTLELTQLLNVIDSTATPMGGRLLREWLTKPLLDVKAITGRQEGVEALYLNSAARGALKKELKEVRDLERLMMRISAGFASPRDLVALRLSLEQIAPLKEHVLALPSELLFQCGEKLALLPTLIETLQKALVEEPPARLGEGKIFRDGYHPPLDELTYITTHGKEWLSRYQTQLKEETGIKTLKVSFNKIFGYYIEVSKGQAHLMPSSFHRRQTLVNSERFISDTLKEYEGKVLSAEEQINALERELFSHLCSQILTHSRAIFETAAALAQIDVLLSLAHASAEHRFCRPLVDLSTTLHIWEGRHPIVEAYTGKEAFIPNETHLDSHERLMLITGPNMAGKSTYIRQVALIVILAQMGSFVPAAKAHIGLIDRIFTRIGAHDDLTRGQSTFMVEMSETANILNNITPRSLVVLDEIGRGTSTYDGVAIAWSVAEYLLGTAAKTLFATHYWELTELEKTVPGAVNYHASVQEWNETIVFLHKIAKGGTDRSYGIHVARLAGLPLPVLQRARSILNKLEARKESAKKEKKNSPETQLTLF